MKFQCSSCSQCCRKVGQHLDRLKSMGFPYDVKADGSCEKLNDKGLCDVYLTRPDVCNVDKIFYLMHSKTGKTKKQVFLEESKICNSWIKEAGLDDKYLIDESQYK